MVDKCQYFGCNYIQKGSKLNSIIALIMMELILISSFLFIEEWLGIKTCGLDESGR